MEKNINKVLKYSIRKLSLGVAPIVVGTLIFGNYVPGNVAKAGEINFKYVDEKELNENEKLQIREEIPQEYKNNETYYLVYKKVDSKTSKVLPKTGESSLPLYGLGLGSATILVLLVSKKNRNKVLSVLLIGALGQSVLLPYETFALENRILQKYNTTKEINSSSELEDGIIDIPGYKYVGFLVNDDLRVIPIRNEEKSLKDKTEVNLAYLHNQRAVKVQKNLSDATTTHVRKQEPVERNKSLETEGGDEVKALVNKLPEYKVPEEKKGTQESR